MMGTGWLHLIRRLAVIAVALVAAAIVAIGTAPAADADSHCPRPGGLDGSFVPSDELMGGSYALRLVGGGWGHAVGMSQYGARGAAELGCSYGIILRTYYQGTALDTRSMASTVRVGFLQKVPRAYVVSEDGDVAWSHCDGSCVRKGTQKKGETWEISSTSSGEYVVKKVLSDGSTSTVFRNVTGGDVRLVHEGKVIDVRDKATSPSFRRRVKWGHHRFTADTTDKDRLYSVQHVTSGDGYTGMERYLWGVAEVPSSWHVNVLRAQAVTARSYASLRIGLTSTYNACRCDLYATVRHQNYTGWQKESEGTDGSWGKRWKSAVNDTTGQVVVYQDDGGTWRIADTFYSSSHGGWSENSEDVWGGTVSYLRAVDSSRWEAAGSNSRQRWERGFTTSQVLSAFNLDEFTSFRVRTRASGGRPIRPDGAVVTGKKDGTTVTREYSGEQLRSRLGLFSGLVYVPADAPVAGVRRGGSDRFATAVSVSQYGWSSSSTVVIARGDDPADALAGSGLAGKLNAPLLLTTSDALVDVVADEVERLGATRAALLGGTGALSENVEQGLRDAGVTEIDRVAGSSRTETAVRIAERLSPPAGGTALLVNDAVVEGRGWPDALSASGVAARRARAGAAWPVLLTGDELPDATRDALDALGTAEVVIVGGTGVVPRSVEDQLKSLGYTVRRLSGGDRYGTSRAVFAGDGAKGPVIAATGTDFPDGLAAGALAGRLDASVLLVPPETLDQVPPHRKWIRDRIVRQPSRVVAVGGTKAVSDTVVAQLREELRLR